MLVCSVNDFLEKLVPFSSGVRWIDSAYDRLKEEKLRQTLPQRNTRAGSRARAEAGTLGHEIGARNENTGQWETYRNKEKNGMKTFKDLKKIIEAIQDCADPDQTRKSNGYRYTNCRYREMASELMGPNFKVDAVIYNPKIYKKAKGAIHLAAAQTAVVIEFKKETKADSDEEYETQNQLAAVANQVMNDDPRRKWMYGITIEKTNMSLWYFSRSYSIKSAPFCSTDDFKKLICVFLSFIYASDEELGHDPSICLVYHGEKWCYVYEVETEEGSKYYRTIEPLHKSCKSRVWKAVEVNSLKDLAPVPGTGEVVLKDCWVDQGSPSEKKIQTQIFHRLKDVNEAEYAWAPLELREKLKVGLAYPETYFMKVVWDWKQGPNKEKRKSRVQPFLLTNPAEYSAVNKGKAAVSTQVPPLTEYPSPHTSYTPTSVTAVSQFPPIPRDYKQRYRVVYAEVGESLAYATSLSDAVRAFEDIFISLTLLFLARWVHRDVSEGNVILVRSKHGVRAKLSDLEYAQFFAEDRTIGTDPKTGTPYFMPLEIHKGLFLFYKPLSNELDISSMALNWNRIRQPEPASPSLRYNFAHDLESLWWIMVWIIVVRIKGAPWLYPMIFTVLGSPHRDRENFFTLGKLLLNRLERYILDPLCDRNAHIFLAIYNQSLCKFYASGERQKASSYQNIYHTVWSAMGYLIQNLSDVNMELENPHLRAPPPPASLSIVPEFGKRSRSADNACVSDRKTTVEDGSSRKKPKSGGDVVQDTNEEDMAEEDMVQAVTEVADGDGN